MKSSICLTIWYIFHAFSIFESCNLYTKNTIFTCNTDVKSCWKAIALWLFQLPEIVHAFIGSCNLHCMFMYVLYWQYINIFSARGMLQLQITHNIVKQKKIIVKHMSEAYNVNWNNVFGTLFCTSPAFMENMFYAEIYLNMVETCLTMNIEPGKRWVCLAMFHGQHIFL